MGRRKTYLRLIGALNGRGYDQGAVAEYLGISKSTCSAKYTAKRPWGSDEMYELMDLLGEPYDRLHVYFPKNGIETPVQRPRVVRLYGASR